MAVVTDLDGCLLDHRTYRAGPARRVLRGLRQRGVPVVLSTSKTRAELAALTRELGGRYPAIIEDGGGIFVPAGAMSRAHLAGARRTRDGRLISLAPGYATIRRAFTSLNQWSGGGAVGFGDMTAAEVARATGLSVADARRARRREFDEPFHFPGAAARNARTFANLIDARRFRISRGGRFWHMHGRTDKGHAMRLVRRILERVHGPLAIVALGDSALDAPMLREAELPIIIPHSRGAPDAALRRLVRRARIAPAPGPSGWARAVRQALADFVPP